MKLLRVAGAVLLVAVLAPLTAGAADQKFEPQSFSIEVKEYQKIDGKMQFVAAEEDDPFLGMFLKVFARLGQGTTLEVSGDLDSGIAVFANEDVGAEVEGTYQYEFAYGEYWMVFRPIELRAPGIIRVILSLFPLPEAYYFKGGYDDGVLKALSYVPLENNRWIVLEAEYK